MTGTRQIWLVATRELRERSRSAAFRVSVVIMILGVAAAIVLPTLLGTGGGTRTVGMAGSAPAPLAQAIQAQAKSVGVTARIKPFDTVAAGETAVRAGKVDVLVVDAARLEWRRQADEPLKAVVTGAIQLVGVQQRAEAGGISAQALGELLTPVPVTNRVLGQVEGRSRDDETAALIMTLVLFLAVTVYGAMVMSGVVEEKTSRVVEVLLARMPARNLLAGKIAGIGLLGLLQVGVTAVAALITVAAVGSFDVPAVRAAVILWAVVWFVVGYALYATVFGALGSLASRTEDTQSVAGPVSGLLIAAYFVSFATVGSPHALWARLLSYFPAFSPFAMPNRVAMGGAAWWEPPVALAVSVAAIAGLIALGGRVYTAAILHTGPTLGLRDAWRRSTALSTRTTGASPAQTEATAHVARSVPAKRNELLRGGALVAAAVAVVAAIFAATSDFIMGFTVGAVFYAIAFRIDRTLHAHH